MNAQSRKPTIPTPQITGRRSKPRVRLHIPAHVILLQGLVSCQLDDLSQAGARVTIAGKLPGFGAGVVLQTNRLDVFGTVVWSQGACFGIAFEEPLPLHEVVNERHFADANAGHEAAPYRRSGRPGLRERPRLRGYS
ncbi:PilZ domain-containing protein [Novosphingobium sp.]|uniref:PilZ domain-containing protein n=1 Tax=Novosphingobium sp. TaxID=1874826 RepID=UPI003BA8E69F